MRNVFKKLDIFRVDSVRHVRGRAPNAPVYFLMQNNLLSVLGNA